MQLQETFDFVFQLKEKLVSERTIRDYKNKVDNFIKWIKEKTSISKTNSSTE